MPIPYILQKNDESAMKLKIRILLLLLLPIMVAFGNVVLTKECDMYSDPGMLDEFIITMIK